MGWSNYTRDKITELAMGISAWALPTVFLAICTGGTLDDDDTGATMTEVADANGYARLALAGLWGTSVDGVLANDTLIEMAEASGAWGTITEFAIMDCCHSSRRNGCPAFSPSIRQRHS